MCEREREREGSRNDIRLDEMSMHDKIEIHTHFAKCEGRRNLFYQLKVKKSQKKVKSASQFPLPKVKCFFERATR